MSIPFRKLGLCGGGIKGILHLGALRELSKHQPLVFPDGVYGYSIGAIIGTYIAFGLTLDENLAKKYLSFDKILPKPTFSDISNVFSEKGIYSTDILRAELIKLFNESGIEIETKKLSDAHMPLYILASNITKGTTTTFAKDVGVLDALLASCCIPGVFKPYELYGQLYVDGGLFVPCLSAIIPDALILFLIKRRSQRIDTTTIKTMNPFDFMKELYGMAMTQFSLRTKSETTVRLEYPKLHSNSNLSEFDIPDILNHSGNILNVFLLAKSRSQKGTQ